MKKRFEGVIHKQIPDNIHINKWMTGENLRILEQASDTKFSVVTHPEYSCTEYRIKLNIFTFSRYNLRIPITIIGPPLSVDSPGYAGNLERLIADYKRRKGIFLMLNLPEHPAIDKGAAIAETLPSCIFQNHFSSFEDYLLTLRSGYRRRIKKALQKGESLRVEQIQNHDFSQEMYNLYLQMRNRSKYPLETLKPNFFRNFDGEIFVFSINNTPAAFIALTYHGKDLSFTFGGMDYDKRDEYDLYLNMIIWILKYAIVQKAERINFGQTAEQTKLRVGCGLSKRYMVAFSGNPIFSFGLRLIAGRLGYGADREGHKCFKSVAWSD